MLAARQLGYWHATPEGSKKSRGQEAIEDGLEPDMPDMAGLHRLWQAWHDIGRTSGLEPLPWSEVEAFGRISGLNAQDQIALRHMSSAYLEGLSLTSPLAIMPMELNAQG